MEHEEPIPPTNVRIRYMDGGESPVECVYRGINSEGIHLWEAVPTSPLVSRYAQIAIDTLPPMTEVSLRVDFDEESV